VGFKLLLQGFSSLSHFNYLLIQLLIALDFLL